MSEPTLNALRACAHFLAVCLKIGWAKSDLDKLESLWWEHRDEQGRLKRSKKKGARQ